MAELLIIGSSAASALGGVVAHRTGSVRGRLGHLLACIAMIAMAVPHFDPLNPLVWFLLLGVVAFWVAGAADPVLTRLTVLQDLCAMAVLVICMPAAAAAPTGAAASGHHAAHGGSSGISWFAPVLVVALWAAARFALWANKHRQGDANSPRTATLVAESGMAAAMTLMVLP